MRMIGCVSPLTGGELRVLGADPATDGPRSGPASASCPRRTTSTPSSASSTTSSSTAATSASPSRCCATARAELLDFVQLGDRADSKVDPLSGGMKRRLTIARALVNEPDLLLLDEPTTGPRPPGPPPGLGAPLPAQAGGRHPGAHHPLHGRGRAAVRPAGDHGRRAASSTRARRAELIARHVTREVVELRLRPTPTIELDARARSARSRAPAIEMLADRAAALHRRRRRRSWPTLLDRRAPTRCRCSCGAARSRTCS